MTDLGKQIEEALTTTIQRVVEDSMEKVVDMAVQRILDRGDLSRLTALSNSAEPEFYTRKEVERILSVSITTIMRWEEQGRLHSEKIRGRRLYRRTMIDSLQKTGDLIKYSVK